MWMCAATLVCGCGLHPQPEPTTGKPVGLVQLIEFHDIQGLRNWAYELELRNMKALVNVQANILDEYPQDVKWLADQGHEVMGSYVGEALWDVPYEDQLAGMTAAKEAVESVTGHPMRVFGSRYFAYDENTLKAADELGVEYIVARGTTDVEALIYEPDEYRCKVISVSNVTFEDMGRGSLCDYSLWARGSTAEDFARILQETLDKHPKRLMLVSHAYLGGMKKVWWQAYKDFLDSEEVTWAADFDEWAASESGVNVRVPMELAPQNREVKYETPTPSEPLDELGDVNNMYNPCGAPDGDGNTNDSENDNENSDANDNDNVNDNDNDNAHPAPDEPLLIFHDSRGSMCLEALDWLADAQGDCPDLVVEEHLTYESGRLDLLHQMEAGFPASEGVSDTFAYLPVIFYRSRAFSGFDDEVAAALHDLMVDACKARSAEAVAR